MIIGIDLSITCSGIVILNKNGDMVSFHTIKTQPKDFANIYKRGTHIMKELDKILSMYPSATVAIEAPAFGARGNGAYSLHGIHFLATMLSYKHNKEPLQVAPTAVKKFATGKGNAPKDKVFEELPKEIANRFISNNYKKSTGLYDLTDAYFIAKLGLHKLKGK